MFRRRFTPMNTPDGVDKLRDALKEADSVIIGAGAGLSTSAGFEYAGERFEKYFRDFADKYHFEDMYSGGFYVMELPPEEQWAFWSRNIYVNRYMDPPKPVYERLFDLVRDKDYFVLTTNVDHCFQKAGFDKHRLFYTQGDYGLWQCSEPCHEKTYDNAETVRAMVEAQGFEITEDGTLAVPKGVTLKMTIPTELVPHCPVCGKPMRMNLRSDGSVSGGSGRIQYARHSQIQLLANDQRVAERHICLPQLWRSIRSGGDRKKVHLHKRRHRRNPESAMTRVRNRRHKGEQPERTSE